MSITRLGFLDSLPEGSRRRFLETGQAVSYPALTALVTPGTGARPGILTAGRLRASLQGPDGRQVGMGYREAGEPFGLVQVFVPEFEVTIEALTSVSVIHLAPDFLRRLMREDSGVATAVAIVLAQTVDSAFQNVRAHVFGDARERIASHILQLAQRDQHGRLVARVTHQQLADAAGTVREHAARVLKEMRSIQVLDTRRGSITVRDEAALRRIATIV
jgi:CRP/FNR family transcriptional regulator